MINPVKHWKQWIKQTDYWQVFSLILCFFTINFHSVVNPEKMVLAGWAISLLLFAFLVFTVFKVGLKQAIQIKLSNDGWLVMLAWLIFAIIIVFSEIRYGVIVDSLVVLFIIPGLMWVLPSTRLKAQDLFLAGWISTLPFFAVTLGLTLIGNQFTSNSIGLTLVTGAICLMAIYELEHTSGKEIPWLSFAFYALTLVLLLAIGSRTSLIIFLICLLWHSQNFIRMNTKHKWKIFLIVLVIIMAALAFLIPNALTKWSSDFSSGRFRIWRISLENLTLFGEGYMYYSNRYILGPHNSFIGIMSFHGLLGLLSYLFFFGISLFVLFKQSFVNRGLSNAMMLMTIGILAGGFFEGFVVYPAYRLMCLLWMIGLGYCLRTRYANETNAKKSSIVSTVILAVIAVFSVYFINPPWFTSLLNLVINR